MNQIDQNPTLYQKIVDNHVDYSEIYRTQETIQLNKRLRKTRNILLICAVAFLAGAGIFWIMPETSFTAKNFLIYLSLAAVMVLLSMYSNKQPLKKRTMKPNQAIKSVLIGSVLMLGLAVFTDVSAQRNQRFDRIENKFDRREDVRDRREDVRDRKEDRFDRMEDRIDRRHNGGLRDRREDVRDRREDVRDRREDIRGHRENKRDRREDRWDRR